MSGWIPQAYYDFVARVVPGSAVILGAYYLKDGPARGISFVFRSLCELEVSWVCRFAVGLLAAYLIGLIIGELGELIAGRALERRDEEIDINIKRECLDEHHRSLAATGQAEGAMTLDDLPGTEVMGEQLALADHYSGSRLLAVRAEQRLCLVLAFGLFMLFIGNLMAFAADLVIKRLVIEGVLVVTLLVLWRRASRLHERAVRQACLGWLMRVSRAG